ncbi:hypothetical protein SPB21_03160 [Leptothoe sp. ISB3NOV94-8A]
MCTICNIVQHYQKRRVVNILSTTQELPRTVLLNPSLSDMIQPRLAIDDSQLKPTVGAKPTASTAN